MKAYAARRSGEPVRYEHTRPFFVPDNLEALHGPTSGTVTLPIHLDWSASNTYILSNPRRVRSLYSTVIQQATSEEELQTYLDCDTLRREWRGAAHAPLCAGRVGGTVSGPRSRLPFSGESRRYSAWHLNRMDLRGKAGKLYRRTRSSTGRPMTSTTIRRLRTKR